MKSEDSQTFSVKHGADASIDDSIKSKIIAQAKESELPCAVAFKIADDLKVSPADVGKTTDLLEFRLVKCQLGLFGYLPEKKIVKAKPPGNQELEDAIRGALVDGRLSCRSIWDIAQQFKVPKMAVSAACEALELKIRPCQLGAF